MKKLFILFCSLCFIFGFSQDKIYKHYLHLSDYSLAPTFMNVNGNLVYSGTNTAEARFFSDKNLTVFEPAFPDGIDISVKNIYYIETTNTTLVSNMKTAFPNLYISSEDITDRNIEMLDYYPNDYGATSPISNLGFNFERIEWDYSHIPKAWDITTGNENIKIGISDQSIYSLDPDVINKVEPYTSSYSLDTIPPTPSSQTHGLDVAVTAAGRGDNAYGSAGVCMNCNIVAAPQGIGTTTQTVFSNLYKIAKTGAKVINMSWCSPCYVNSNYVPSTAEQNVINDLVNNYRVTLVAASGNKPSWSTSDSFISDPHYPPGGTPWSPFGELFVYPASYDNVISVGSIMQKNLVENYWNDNIDFVPDSVSGYVINGVGVLNSGIYQNQWNPNGFVQYTFTLNDKVDILAPGFQIYRHSGYLTNPPINYGFTSGTSFSAPTVSGTIGLMLSLNNCLYPSEIEAILKLTTKDIEVLPLNQNFVGNVGSGKLEVGDAVEFTNEMKKVDGNAVIDNHIFNRFDFNLSKINNKLSISNVTFENDCKANFEARNQIHLLPGTNLKPNTVGNTHLSINPSIDISCTPVVFPRSSNNSTVSKNEALNKVVLSPNPNNGSFRLLNINYNDFGKQPIQLEIFDINGRNLYKKVLNEDDIINCEVNLNDLTSGIYFVKLSSSIRTVGIKFMKN